MILMQSIFTFFLLCLTFEQIYAKKNCGTCPSRKPARCHSSSSSSSSSSSCHRKPKPKPKCPAEKAVEVVRRMVKQWPDYVNTGNFDFLIKNWLKPGATIEVRGDPLVDRCDARIDSVLDYLYYRDTARVLSDLVNIKALNYHKDGTVVAVFVTAAGVKGHDLALYNESWVFKPKCGCEYVLAEANETKVGCLKQDTTCNYN